MFPKRIVPTCVDIMGQEIKCSIIICLVKGVPGKVCMAPMSTQHVRGPGIRSQSPKKAKRNSSQSGSCHITSVVGIVRSELRELLHSDNNCDARVARCPVLNGELLILF